jgi:orotate phosphoribosyltransferase
VPDTYAREVFTRALLRGTFTLRSGAVSDRYFDKYRVSCDPALLAATSGRLAERLARVAPDATRIVAPELGAVPLAAGLALAAQLPFVIVRSTAKGYGTANRIEGELTPGEHAVLVEDVVTSGGAALDALEVARACDLHVAHALCVLDRDGGGREALAAQGVQLHALLDAGDLNSAFDAGIGTEVTA